jgi:hypothetical protein
MESTRRSEIGGDDYQLSVRMKSIMIVGRLAWKIHSEPCRVAVNLIEWVTLSKDDRFAQKSSAYAPC